MKHLSLKEGKKNTTNWTLDSFRKQLPLLLVERGFFLSAVFEWLIYRVCCCLLISTEECWGREATRRGGDRNQGDSTFTHTQWDSRVEQIPEAEVDHGLRGKRQASGNVSQHTHKLLLLFPDFDVKCFDDCDASSSSQMIIPLRYQKKNIASQTTQRRLRR